LPLAWRWSVNEREKFVGDFDRNEVEIDLNKFMELIKENSDLKERIRELEFEDRQNPWQKWVHAAKTLDAWRIFPRMFISVYMFLLYYTTIWFMSLDSPTLEQSGLISVIVGAGAAWFGLYTRSKGDGDSD
jgi:hypothetical protein